MINFKYLSVLKYTTTISDKIFKNCESVKEGDVLFNDTQHILFYGYVVSDI